MNKNQPNRRLKKFLPKEMRNEKSESQDATNPNQLGFWGDKGTCRGRGKGGEHHPTVRKWKGSPWINRNAGERKRKS